MTFEQFTGILPVLLFIAGACVFLWLTRERPAESASPSQPASPPVPAPVAGDNEVVAAVATALNPQRLPPAQTPDDGEMVAAIAIALRHQRKC